jgi:hypothetical protein
LTPPFWHFCYFTTHESNKENIVVLRNISKQTEPIAKVRKKELI